MKKLPGIIFICIIFISSAFCQDAKYPFPQKIKYLYGNLPTKRDTLTGHLKKWYANWKNKYLQECNGNLRPGVDPLSKSLVEAQGFSMIAVAYMADKAVFDKLYGYYKSKITTQGCGLMGWKHTCGGFEDQGSATDGDVDVACALTVAHWQWPDSGYDVKLKAILTSLDSLIDSCGDVFALHPGCAGGKPWGGCDETDISYYEPAFFRYFAKISGNPRWAKLADDTHIIRDAAANKTTGLVPDWQSTSGRAGANGRKGYFSQDAIRAPYKQSLDFLWNGNEKVQAWAKKISSWGYGIGISNIKDGHNLDGSANGGYHNMAVTGSIAVAAMANEQKILDAYVDDCLRLKDESWYNGYLGNLYLLALSGNMWNPDILNPSGTVKPDHKNQLSKTVPQIRLADGKVLLISGLDVGTIISLHAMNGQMIARGRVTQSDMATLNVKNLNRGCCLVRVNSSKGREIISRVVTLF
jgi:endo-1,4-beta-D-glucanase Y